MSVSSRPQKTALIVAKRVVEDIYKSGQSAGDRLPPERVMLEHYGVGRGTLREALRFLELQGVLTLKPGPGGGPVIEKPDATYLANGLVLLLQFSESPFSMIVEARGDLEPVMARHAASRMSAESMTQLGGSVEKMRENLADREIFLATNREFHELIAWGSGNAMYGFLIDATSSTAPTWASTTPSSVARRSSAPTSGSTPRSRSTMGTTRSRRWRSTCVSSCATCSVATPRCSTRP